MKKLLGIIIAALFTFSAIAPAHSASKNVWNSKPGWVPIPADFAFDFAHARWFGPYQMGFASGNSLNRCTGTLYCFSGSSAASNVIFGQWKDGIVRPVGKSTDSNIPRITDYGLWIEDGPSSGTNFLLQSRDLTQTGSWTATNITTTKTGIVGADATTGNATQLTATSANGTILQTITNAGAIYASATGVNSTIATAGTGYTNGATVTAAGGTCATPPTWTLTASGGVPSAVTVLATGSCASPPPNPVAVTGGGGVGLTLNAAFLKVTMSAWVKCVTCTGAIYETADNSTFTDVSAQLSTTKFTQVRVPTVNRGGNTAGFKIANSGDVIIADFSQLESDDQATSPIWTTSAAVTRGPEDIYIGTNASNFNSGLQFLKDTQSGTGAWYRFVYSGNFSTLKQHSLLSTDTNWTINGSVGAGTMNSSIVGGGTSITTSNSDVSGLYLRGGSGTVNSYVISFDGTGAKACLNGVITKQASPVPQAFTGSHANLLNNGSNILPTKGYIAEFDAGMRGLTDAECLQLSNAANYQ